MGIATVEQPAGLDAPLLVDCAEHYFLFSRMPSTPQGRGEPRDEAAVVRNCLLSGKAEKAPLPTAG